MSADGQDEVTSGTLERKGFLGATRDNSRATGLETDKTDDLPAPH